MEHGAELPGKGTGLCGSAACPGMVDMSMLLEHRLPEGSGEK